jgi:hypothetical protein
LLKSNFLSFGCFSRLLHHRQSLFLHGWELLAKFLQILPFVELALMEVAWQNSCAMIEQRGKEEEGGYLYPHSKWSRCSFRGAG